MGEITKIVFTGTEGSGKSLEMAKLARKLVYRNSRWLKKTGVMRPIVSNMKFSQEFEEFARKKGIEVIYYVTLAEMIQYTECDMFIDELAKYFSARQWQDMSLDAISWITQGGKQGVFMVASTQDFSQIEKTFRLLTSRVFVVTKLIGSARPTKSKPKPLFIWGLYVTKRVKPRSFKGDDVTMETIGFPQLYRIIKKDCIIFDTGQKISKSPPLPLEHIVRYCPDTTCKLHLVGHVTHR